MHSDALLLTYQNYDEPNTFSLYTVGNVVNTPEDEIMFMAFILQNSINIFITFLHIGIFLNFLNQLFMFILHKIHSFDIYIHYMTINLQTF